ncbi:MAG: fused MFS/spermidine synthase [Bryobacteraceae bacterium]
MTVRQSIPAGKLFRILACFFLSGMAGLIYQVAWVKALGLIFGHAVYAVATVLAVFMGALAAGSAYLGRWSERHPDPVALYARLEFLAGLTGALSLAGLHGVHLLYAASYPALGDSRPLLLGMRFLGAAVVLFVPTFLMGGTFPILVSGTANSDNEVAKRVSQLYWSNAVGAVSGTLLAGFALLPVLGLRLTILSAAALNGIAGLIALFVRKRTTDAPGKKALPRAAKSTIASSEQRPFYALLFFFGVVGCTAFAYEIAWTRLLAIAIGSSTYAFTLMLAAFLAGLAIGSALFQLFVSRSGPASMTTLSWVQIAIALAALSSLIAFHWIPELIAPLLRATGRTFSGLVMTQLVAAALTVLPAAIVFGFNFPMVIDLIYRDARGRSNASAPVGTAYAANTAGAIAGSMLTGFWLIPWLGSFHVIAAVAAVNLLLALSIHVSSPPRRLLFVATDCLLLAAAFLVASSSFLGDQRLLSLSAVLYGSSYQGRLTLAEIAATKDLVFTAEGVNDSIAVVRTDGEVALRVNGKVDASTEDIPTQLLLGHLGAAFHPSPRRVLVIGFGSGMTASAVARYPDVQEIDCVEIEPAVIRAAPYLDTLNRNVLSDPRVHVISDDARNFLLTSREKYDLIISEPSNPWIAGIATLFTDEYYAAARQRLRPNGRFVQWVQAYSLAPGDLRMIAGTFARHFPEVTLWRAGETDLLLLGRTDPSPFKFDRLRSLWGNTALRQDFASLDIHQPEGLVAYFLLDDAGVRQLAKNGILNTDDRTALEYRAPRSLLSSDLIEIDQKLIAKFRRGPLPEHLDPSEKQHAAEAGLTTALDLNDAANAEAFLKALGSEPESSALAIAKGRLALLQGAVSQAKTFFEAAARSDPESPEAADWLARAEHLSGDDDAALSTIDRILQSHPQFLPALEDQMKLAADRGDFQTALSAQLKRMALMPDPPAYEYGRLGALWLKTPDFAKAESALLKGLAKNRYCYACHFELGELYVANGKFLLARRNFQWVVRFFPDSDAAAFRSLVGIDLLLRDTQSAKAVLKEGLRLFPDDAALLKAQAGLGG